MSATISFLSIYQQELGFHCLGADKRCGNLSQLTAEPLHEISQVDL